MSGRDKSPRLKAVTSYRTPNRNSLDPIWHLRGLRWRVVTPASFVAHDTQAVSSFARQAVHQPAGVFVSKARRFTATVTDDGPFFFP
jgi:hypothetical protein